MTMRFKSRRDLALFVAGVVFLAMWIVALFWQTARPLISPAPFEYTDAAGHAQSGQVMHYQADRSVICAGQSLTFRVYVSVNDVPTSLQSDYAIRNEATGRSIAYGLFSRDPSRIGNPFTEPTSFGAAIAWPIPVSTPPGRYRFEVVVHDGIHASNGFNVFFNVVNCGGPS